MRDLLPRLLSLLLGVLPTAAPALAQPFTYTFVEAGFPTLSYGSVDYADVDRDGDFDVIAGGNTNRFQPFTPSAFVAYSEGEELVQVGEGQAWEHAYNETMLGRQLWHTNTAWADYDGDGDLDLVMTGTTQINPPFEAATVLYRGDGDVFTAVEADLPDLLGGTASWADYDNDGDPDLLLTGVASDEATTTALLRNDGGTFAPVEAGLRDVAFGDARWADYDNDGDLDLLLSGADVSGGFFTDLYRNDGGSFTDTNAGFMGLAFSAADWGDYDSDGDLDLLLSGGILSPQVLDGVTKLYRNDGGAFNEVDAGLDGIVYGAARWGDYDNDGRLDILLAGGRAALGTRLTRIYKNEGNGFRHSITLAGAAIADADWGDYDSDGDLDLLVAGLSSDGGPLTNLYRNDHRLVNTPPTAPAGLQTTVDGDAATLAWSAAADEQSAALTYNLRVGTAPGAADVVAPLASTDTGYRWIPARGNVDQNTRWTVRGLPAGTYYWSVQAVDAAYQGSPFAAEGTFSVSAAGGNGDVGTGADEADLPTRVALHPAFPNPFRDQVTLRYDLPSAAHVALTVYNILGAEVARLLDGAQPAGRRQVTWNGRDESGRRLGAGVYFVRMQAGTHSQSQKLVLLH